MIMDYNFHTHTYRCGHAEGQDEEYVLRAIKNGIKELGFSDHIPLLYPDGYQAGYRVKVETLNDYFSSLNSLKEKYKDKIDIKIGFECEYFEELFEEMLEKAIDWGTEYLILGQHFFHPEHSGNPRAVHVALQPNDASLLEEYAESIVKAIKTGKFSYVAHPDMFNFEGDKKTYQQIMRKICVASKEYNIPLEINLLGIQGKRIYPNPDFWEVVAEEKSPVTFGCDAHTPLSVYNQDAVTKAEQLVERFALNYIGKSNLILLK